MSGYTYLLVRWCDRCQRPVETVVHLLTERPTDRYWRQRWDDGARREAEAKYQEQHVAGVHAWPPRKEGK